MSGRKFIITNVDTGCPHSWLITEYDTDIIVPTENKTYQFLVSAKNSFQEQIIISRILQELYQRDVRDCEICMGKTVTLSQQMKRYLKLLSVYNNVQCK